MKKKSQKFAFQLEEMQLRIVYLAFIKFKLNLNFKIKFLQNFHEKFQLFLIN